MAIRKRRKLSKTMDEKLLREISVQYLLPFFSGARIDLKSASSSSAENTVAFINPQTIGFKVNKADTYRLKFGRDQPFAPKPDSARETRVIEAFVGVLEEMNDELKGPLKDDLLSTFQRRVVARSVAERGEDRELLAVIDQMALWATRLYEGAPISSAIGIDPEAVGAPYLKLAAIAKNDFSAVLSNGFDTLLVFDSYLNFTGHSVVPPSATGVHTCPWRHSSIAEWTAKVKGRVAVVLNRLGEILVFRDGQLLFVRRSGTWHFLTHGPILGQMVVPRDKTIRTVLYETALDASFARTGACIGVVSSDSGRAWEEIVVPNDRLSLKESDKSKALAKVVAGKKFQELDRTLRQELVAIDGATVINHKGEVLAIGAILRIGGGSSGGGRTAAAKTLARCGLGIKISQDGGITAYRMKAGRVKGEQVAFKVM